MNAAKLPAAVWDPIVKRYKAPCPYCGWFAARTKMEAAEHALAQHAIYQHDHRERS